MLQSQKANNSTTYAETDSAATQHTSNPSQAAKTRHAKTMQSAARHTAPKDTNTTTQIPA